MEEKKGKSPASMDITRLKQVEQALAEAKEELELKVKEHTEELARVQAELLESSQFAAALLENAPNPIIVSYPDGSIRYVNHAFENLTGFTRDEVLGKMSPYPWWSPELTPQYEIEDESGRNKEKNRLIRHHRKKNGERLWVVVDIRGVKDETGVRYYIANWVDVTRHRLDEEQIELNERQLRDLVDAMSEGVSLIGLDGKILRANSSLAALHGLDKPDSMMGEPFRNPGWRHINLDGSPLPDEETATLTALKKGVSVRNKVIGAVKEDGSITWFNVNAIPVKDESGQVVAVVRTQLDITEQKQMRDEKERFTQRLIEVQEEERNRISRELHDDTAQWLALLLLEMDDVVDKGRQLPPDTVSRLKKLRESTNKALWEVRRFSHELRPSILGDFGLNAALELIVGEFNTVDAAVKTQVHLDAQEEGDRLPKEIELVLFRIAQESLSNIRKHARAKEAYVSLEYDEDRVTLTITDNGRGFDTRKKPSDSIATGLGLVGMRERAQLVGGQLTVKSSPGKGTTVSITVPIKKG